MARPEITVQMIDGMRADLHLHTTASDGSDTPRELLCKARENGIDVVSITDHDTIAGLKELSVEDFNGLKVITGIEFSWTPWLTSCVC